MGAAVATGDAQWELAATGRTTSFTENVEGPMWEINGAREALDLMDEITTSHVVAPIVLVGDRR